MVNIWLEIQGCLSYNCYFSHLVAELGWILWPSWSWSWTPRDAKTPHPRHTRGTPAAHPRLPAGCWLAAGWLMAGCWLWLADGCSWAATIIVKTDTIAIVPSKTHSKVYISWWNIVNRLRGVKLRYTDPDTVARQKQNIANGVRGVNMRCTDHDTVAPYF